jgi:hypothetical protein
VPRLRAEVALILVDDEAVLFEEDTGGLHRVDAIGALVLSYFDEDSTLASIANELAKVFDAENHIVEEDLIRMSRQLGQKGLLEGVRGHDVQEISDEC